MRIAAVDDDVAGSRNGSSSSMNSSTACPAFTINITRRGRFSNAIISPREWAPMMRVPLASCAEEIVHLGHRPVVGHHGESVVVHVQNQVLTHHGQSNHGNVCVHKSVQFEQILAAPYKTTGPAPTESDPSGTDFQTGYRIRNRPDSRRSS